MGSKERPADRGSRRANEIRTGLGAEARRARQERNLSLREVARAVGLSASEVSRIERGLVPGVSIYDLSQIMAVVGLDLSSKAYPGGQPIRDAAQIALLAQFRARLHASLRWRAEVPMPIAGDQRAWDGTIDGPGWTYGTEAETGPRDAQALIRRVSLKIRDAAVDGAILVLPDTRRARTFLREAAEYLRPQFPVDGARALELLRAGVDPGGSSIVVI